MSSATWPASLLIFSFVARCAAGSRRGVRMRGSGGKDVDARQRGKDARGTAARPTASWRAASRRMVCCVFLVMPPHLLSLLQVNMDTPPSKSSQASKALKYAKDELRATKKKMRDVQDCDEKLFQSLKRIKKARERNMAEIKKHKDSINSLNFVISDLKSRHETVAASPESACTDYTFPEDSEDEEMVRALDMRDEKISGEDGKGNEKETSV